MKLLNIGSGAFEIITSKNKKASVLPNSVVDVDEKIGQELVSNYPYNFVSIEQAKDNKASDDEAQKKAEAERVKKEKEEQKKALEAQKKAEAEAKKAQEGAENKEE